MASPFNHIIVSSIIGIAAAIVHKPEVFNTPKVWAIVAAICFGTFIDLDHLPWRRIKNSILQNDPSPIPGWINWMHDWPGLMLSFLVSLIALCPFPLISYLVHMIMDAANTADGKDGVSPIPQKIASKIPKWCRYYSNPLKN